MFVDKHRAAPGKLINLRVSHSLSGPLLAGAVVLGSPWVASAEDLGSFCDLVLNVNGTGVGAIPDRGTAGCGPPAGPPLTISFDVNSVPGYRLETLDVTANITHTWTGDLAAILIEPGGIRNHTLFGRVGATTSTACGDSSDLGAVYGFSDAATLNLWTEASATGAGIIPSAVFRTTDSGGEFAVNPMPPTQISNEFGGMTYSETAGTWTLRVTDTGGGDTGSVSSATLSLCFIQAQPEIFKDGFEP